jgi:hypothetical protein
VKTGLDAEIDKLGSDIETLAKGVDAHLLERARKLAPKPLSQAQVRALLLGSSEDGARRAGQKTGFGITAKTAAQLVGMELLVQSYLSGNYLTTAAGKLVLDFPENKRRADTMRRLGT